VEDDPGDRLLTEKSLSATKLDLRLSVVEDGEQALQYLRRQPPYENAAFPDIVLLDLNLPKKDGREVLAEIRQDPDLTHLPVVILTTSQSESDILKSYELHANCYITKPVDLTKFREVLRALENFWFTVVTLPRTTKAKHHEESVGF
jgi:two-component system response regulator